METNKFFRLCHNCGKEGTNLCKCSKCKIAYYCERKCQINHWNEHKNTCNLTTKSHSMLIDDLNFIITNIKFIWLLKALTYHFLHDNDDQFLMCVIDKNSENNQNFYRGSFLINHIDVLKNKPSDVQSKIVWLVFMNKENNTCEGGFRFNINQCKEYYEFKDHIKIDEVNTIKDIIVEGADITFNNSIKKYCKVLMTDDINICLFIYNDNEILL